VGTPNAYHDLLLADADDYVVCVDILGDQEEQAEDDFCFDQDATVMDRLRRDVADFAAAPLAQGTPADLANRPRCCKRRDCIFSLLNMRGTEVRDRTLEIYVRALENRAKQRVEARRSSAGWPSISLVGTNCGSAAGARMCCASRSATFHAAPPPLKAASPSSDAAASTTTSFFFDFLAFFDV